MPVAPLPPEALRRSPSTLLPKFKSTEEVTAASGVIGQDRALAAIEFSAGMHHNGYNMFVMGPAGVGRHTLLAQFLEEKSKSEPTPTDWVYVHNFQVPHQPNALELPTGRGTELKRRMEDMIEELNSSIPSIFESDEYRTRRNAIQTEMEQRHETVFESLRKKAVAQDIVMMQTPQGFAFAPVREGEVMRPEVFQQLSDDERKKIQDAIDELQKELQTILEKLPRWDKERRDAMRGLNREVSQYAIAHALEDVRAAFADHAECLKFLEDVQSNLIENVDIFVESEEPAAARALPFPVPDGAMRQSEALRRYSVNVVVDNSKTRGAPVVREDNPLLPYLVGRVEHKAQFGALVTDFTLIKSGSIHRANGGYLIMDVVKLLSQPFAWETLKRTLRAQQVKIETPAEALGMISTVSLEPEPIPLQLRVILIGERQHYYLLSQHDPDFADLFKVVADFNETLVWDEANMQRYVTLIASIARQQGLKPLTRDAVVLVIEQSARIADDAERLSLLVGKITDLLREADYWAGKNGHAMTDAADIRQAIAAEENRVDRIRDRALESITREIMLIDTDGAKVGQINGLSVSEVGNFRFGRPTRITARIGLGAGKVVDIEREVELGGPLHSKGVLILAGFIAATFGADMPLSLSASLVFEQSYGGVDGDSASSAELYVLLSAIAEVPVKQSFAVTGSVNQHGEVQAIGGVNEKIEGFFDICKSRGLTGEQGVMIPKANTKHLVLRPDVVAAVAEKRFQIYPVARIEEGIELLTGMPAGKRGKNGEFPDGTIFRKVADRLREMAEVRQRFAQQRNSGEAGNDRAS
ncbi:MAG: Lon protease family protein [Alphaproteobacteria bacterium]